MAVARKPRATKASTAKNEVVTPDIAPTRITTQAVDIQEAIRNRAYELYLQRGSRHGHHVEDWLHAESEVMSRFSAKAAA